MKTSKWRIVAFAAVLVALAGFQISQIQSVKMTMADPILGDEFGSFYLCELYFPGQGYAVLNFDTPENIRKFARLSNVEILYRQPKLTEIRTDIVVEAQHAE